MLRRLFDNRRLESSFSLTTALIVICVVGIALAVMRVRVGSVLIRGMNDRGYAVSQSIGAVSTPALLSYNYVALQAAAEHAVDAPEIVVEGILEGDAVADRIELRGTSRVRASLETPRLILEEGCFLEGRCRTEADPQKADSGENSLPRSP